jgi:hypothetical protein
MLGALIPFALVFAFGLNTIFTHLKLNQRAKFLAFAASLLLIVAGEAASSWPAFFSQYNWFHYIRPPIT